MLASKVGLGGVRATPPGVRLVKRTGNGMALRGIPPILLLLAYVSLALTPLGLAAWQGLPPRPFRDEFSSAIAMVGFSMLLVEFVLSGRFRWVSGRIGIDITMRFHQVIARGLAVFILIHPFLYSLPSSSPRPWDNTGQLTLGLSGASFSTGVLAWLLLPTLVLMGIFRGELPYRYETWRLMHGLGAALIALFTLHHAVDGGRYSNDPGLAIFWIILVIVAFSTLLQVYIIGPLIQLRHRYRVVSVKPIATKTWELVIEPERGSAITFEAGQFAWLTLGRSPFSITEHPFSMSSCPSDTPRVSFAIKEVGDFTRTIGSVQVGTSAYLDGPHGNMIVRGKSGVGVAFIAGGVGLAPIMSILRQLREDRDRRPIKLVYGNRVAEQIMYEGELADMKSDLSIEIHHVLSEPPPGWTGAVGQVDEALLEKLLGTEDRGAWLYVVCGPGPMIDSVENSLSGLGIPLRQILAEKFDYD
ncbi:MAG: hypothetical protein E4H28_07515 [Gemmatimonadales bacterium]|nr:MAG: hypothetical protein E4H28_07515 [Gemmatimonadales bacterium]